MVPPWTCARPIIVVWPASLSGFVRQPDRRALLNDAQLLHLTVVGDQATPLLGRRPAAYTHRIDHHQGVGLRELGAGHPEVVHLAAVVAVHGRHAGALGGTAGRTQGGIRLFIAALLDTGSERDAGDGDGGDLDCLLHLLGHQGGGCQYPLRLPDRGDHIATEALSFQTGYLSIEREEQRFGEYWYRLRYPNHDVYQSLNNSLL